MRWQLLLYGFAWLRNGCDESIQLHKKPNLLHLHISIEEIKIEIKILKEEKLDFGKKKIKPLFFSSKISNKNHQK